MSPLNRSSHDWSAQKVALIVGAADIYHRFESRVRLQVAEWVAPSTVAVVDRQLVF